MNKPKIVATTPYNLEKSIEDLELYNKEFNENVDKQLSINSLTIDSCIFNNIDLSLID